MQRPTPASPVVTRRGFLAGASAAGLFTILPRHVLGGPGFVPPSEKLGVALIGAGGRGASLATSVAEHLRRIKVEAEEGQEPTYREEIRPGETLVAFADVDDERCKGTRERFPKAVHYRDFRKLLEERKDVDAVIVATPDHCHAPAAMLAIRLGLHVYVEKPMTHSIYEARRLMQAAAEAGVQTQMGNQGRSGEGIRLIREWIQAGAIGAVSEVHCWTDRPIWPQGMDRPAETPEVPSTLDWDLWLGPAPQRPYHPDYLPFKWRGWWDFGTGALGDMGCHIVDPVFYALDLGSPLSVEASSTKVNAETAPLASLLHFRFPARGAMPPVTLHWYDGGIMPERPRELEPGRRMGDADGGVLFVGDKGLLMCGCYGASPRLIPETAMRAYERLPPRVCRARRATWPSGWPRARAARRPARISPMPAR